jgi:hypothetical protein
MICEARTQPLLKAMIGQSFGGNKVGQHISKAHLILQLESDLLVKELSDKGQLQKFPTGSKLLIQPLRET